MGVCVHGCVLVEMFLSTVEICVWDVFFLVFRTLYETVSVFRVATFLCLWFFLCSCRRVCMLCACVCVEIIPLLLTTWREAARWEKLKENLILETTIITKLLSFGVCLYFSRHTHINTEFLREDTVSVTSCVVLSIVCAADVGQAHC